MVNPSSASQIDRSTTFQEFLETYSPASSLWSFGVNLVLTAGLCYVLRLVYVRYGKSLSNRSSFSRNFVLIGTTTMLIISIVKSSLALSLGLVGALSIVRFRTAIKEPEELAFLFLTIAIGLGLGANQRIITLVAVAIIIGGFAVRGLFAPGTESSNLYLTVRRDGDSRLDLGQVTRILKDNCAEFSLMRFDESGETMEACYLVDLEGYDQLERVKRALQDHGPVAVSFVDSTGMA